MSRYVQRCLGCRKVRGVSAFGVERGGGRKPVCKWCEETAGGIATRARSEMAPLLREQAALLAKLTRVRRRIRSLESELLDAERRLTA